MNAAEFIDLETAERMAQNGDLRHGEFAGDTTAAKPQSDHRKMFEGEFSMEDLASVTFPPVKWIVDGLVPEGCTVLAGPPKSCKSWFCLDVGVAVASGNYCFGDYKCVQGDVLYLALEDNPRRLKDRLEKITTTTADKGWRKRLRFRTKVERCDEGGLEHIRGWLNSVQNPRLVIVDVLQKFRSNRGRSDTLYEGDYGAITALQELAAEYSVGVLIVHHTRKGNGDGDPFEEISGTNGITGAADTSLVLKRGSNGSTLYCRGRDVEEYEKAILWDREACRWIIQGDATEVRRTSERGAILAVLEDAEEPLKPVDIANLADMRRNNVDRLLGKMMKAGEILKAGRGQYVHPSKAHLVPSTPGKNGKKVRNREDGDK
ncbi:AAA family ATPase [Aestuariivirga sp.]|uniref:AAA family ATPase n=1 Tax=Aestuariivirga sp. TaxID=2650926 RepID=UPI00391D91EE